MGHGVLHFDIGDIKDKWCNRRVHSGARKGGGWRRDSRDMGGGLELDRQLRDIIKWLPVTGGETGRRRDKSGTKLGWIDDLDPFVLPLFILHMDPRDYVRRLMSSCWVVGLSRVFSLVIVLRLKLAQGWQIALPVADARA
jgi:hypothetical protein